MTRAPTKARVSRTPRGLAWLKQFKEVDQKQAAEFADALVLLNETDVADAVHDGIAALSRTRRLRRRVIGVYPEREFGRSLIFESELRKDRDGKDRMRAFGKNGPPAIVGIRGSQRVGSEGSMASIVSQAVGAARRKLANRPGPDRIRTRQVDMILIATDFIGSGGRVLEMLDNFMRTASVRAWRSNDWIEFAVVAAAGTAAGIAAVEAHRTRPRVWVNIVASTLDTYPDQERAAMWRYLAYNYGPDEDRGGGRLGYDDGGALIAFNYRAPNNTPLIFHSRKGGWKPLLLGPAGADVREAFGLAPLEARLEAQAGGDTDLLTGEQKLKVVLQAIEGQWRAFLAVGFAERTGLTVPEVEDTIATARGLKLLDEKGHITDLGHAFIGDAGRPLKRNKTLPTREQPYYPKSLRVPR